METFPFPTISCRSASRNMNPVQKGKIPPYCLEMLPGTGISRVWMFSSRPWAVETQELRTRTWPFTPVLPRRLCFLVTCHILHLVNIRHSISPRVLSMLDRRVTNFRSRCLCSAELRGSNLAKLGCFMLGIALYSDERNVRPTQ
ncbi:hypothetical protein BS47DRAFT_1011082 [Hydnum rufescens UP504]|uniref:Uncharacterized protein n=1 Tax=Hydnum rufescens UP504 TaxID=1448309 RepID=A0A9P6AWM4_9AGAM|nr:hypothetical protein BS47DRAFT_1011082 [Hydnum rufescens UP504]